MERTGAGQWGPTGDGDACCPGRGHAVLCPPAAGHAGQGLSLPLWCGIEGANTQTRDGWPPVDTAASFLSGQLANVLIARPFSSDSQREARATASPAFTFQGQQLGSNSTLETASEEGKLPSSELD